MRFPALCLLLFLAPCFPPLALAQTHVAVPRVTHPSAGQTLYFVLTDRFENGKSDNDTGAIPAVATITASIPRHSPITTAATLWDSLRGSIT
ncbi:MAG: hypothetical protein NVV63_04975 [Opitutus sp.]|nr:hypothetical protein [Opitutus sp.]